MFSNYVCALDIGTSKVCALLCEIRKNAIVNIFLKTSSSRGLKRGMVIDSLALSETVAEILKDLKAQAGKNIKFIYANISGDGITTKHSRAIIPLAERGNKIITSSDMQRAQGQALILGSSIEEEIVHHIPYNYAIDSNANIPNPLGLYSHKLEVDLFLVCVKLSCLQNIAHAVNQAGYDLKGLFFSGLATANAVFGFGPKKGLSLLCDVGGDLTELLVFKDGFLKNVEILPVGGNDLTQELSDELKIPLDLAEEIKKAHGIIGDSSSGREAEILLKKNNVYQTVKQKLVCKIITSKAESICYKLKESVSRYIKNEEVKNFFVTGRTVFQEGFLEMLETILGIRVSFGRLSDGQLSGVASQNEALSGNKYLTYLTGLGIIAQVMHERQSKTAVQGQSSRNPAINVFHKIQEVYQEYF